MSSDAAGGAPGPTPHEESWFGSFRSTGDSPSLTDDSRFAASWQSEPEVSARGGAARTKAMAGTTFERIYRAFIAARAALGLAVAATVSLAGAFGLRPPGEVIAISAAYAVLSISMWLLPRLRRGAAPHAFARLQSPQWIATVGADLLLFTALHLASPAQSMNYVALLVLPVLMAGVLTPKAMALATAAVATLGLLAVGWLKAANGGDATVLMTQAALAGSGFFVIALLAGELAGRLAREELSARGSLELARQQAQLNRLVIEEMEDGVLVVDRAGKVRAANPAARRLLAPEGTSRPAPFQLRGVPAWGALVAAVERAFAEASWPEVGRDVPLQFSPDAHRTLRVRVRFTRKREPAATEEFCVLFLEDVRNVQARSRQEKLAAMGRVSAGIAHEIRNPLAAISQANALLSEDATDPAQRQLMHMVTENVERLKRIVDDVLEVAPGRVQEVGAIDATAQIAAFCSEWASAAGMPAGAASVLRLDLPGRPLGVLFDAEHLRRVLVNLLDNARRHASDKPGAIVVRLQATLEGDARAAFSVLSDGPPIPAEVEPYLFEPFFSTRSRGAGLGLYICRELCERYGARIDYRLLPPGQRHRNDFFVDMRRGTLQPADARLHLTP
ncbi:MAG TPA: ATP-binding protein [Caldimonas sp.]|jgi:two-component system sensor histidine kinase PilS (NtrC family)|nr:ATP-binding protein [Caldimonas sp.]HEX2540886.1 ATP-binding protein [Caldimonas sp.]